MITIRGDAEARAPAFALGLAAGIVHDGADGQALPPRRQGHLANRVGAQSSADARRSEEHTSELQSLMRISYAVFCLKKKKTPATHTHALYLAKQHTHSDAHVPPQTTL